MTVEKDGVIRQALTVPPKPTRVPPRPDSNYSYLDSSAYKTRIANAAVRQDEAKLTESAIETKLWNAVTNMLSHNYTTEQQIQIFKCWLVKNEDQTLQGFFENIIPQIKQYLLNSGYSEEQIQQFITNPYQYLLSHRPPLAFSNVKILVTALQNVPVDLRLQPLMENVDQVRKIINDSQDKNAAIMSLLGIFKDDSYSYNMYYVLKYILGINFLLENMNNAGSLINIFRQLKGDCFFYITSLCCSVFFYDLDQPNFFSKIIKTASTDELKELKKIIPVSNYSEDSEDSAYIYQPDFRASVDGLKNPQEIAKFLANSIDSSNSDYLIIHLLKNIVAPHLGKTIKTADELAMILKVVPTINDLPIIWFLVQNLEYIKAEIIKNGGDITLLLSTLNTRFRDTFLNVLGNTFIKSVIGTGDTSITNISEIQKLLPNVDGNRRFIEDTLGIPFLKEALQDKGVDDLIKILKPFFEGRKKLIDGFGKDFLHEMLQKEGEEQFFYKITKELGKDIADHIQELLPPTTGCIIC